MGFLERNLDKRGDITSLVEGARSVIMAGIRYYSNGSAAGEDNYFVSRYARVKDYHMVIEEKLTRVQKIIKKEVPDAVCRVFCDAGPVTEQTWAIRAGLGWRGKHSLVINRDIGSYFFLGEIVTTAEFIYDNATSRDRCGDCTLCLEACPTGLFAATGPLMRAVASPISPLNMREIFLKEFRGKTERIIFGCDRCQEVCPWNRKAVPYSE
jgi:epoxyqueuosine reductase